MNARFLFCAVMVGAVLPFVLVSIMLSMTKKLFIILTFIVLLTLSIAILAQTEIGYRWLRVVLDPHIMAPLSVSTLVVLAIYGLVERRMEKTRESRDFWLHKPYESEFARYCIDSLTKAGWMKHTTRYESGFTICRMEKDSKRFTVFFSASSLRPEVISNKVSQISWKPYGRSIIILWEIPKKKFIDEAKSLHWRVLHCKDLIHMASAYDQQPADLYAHPENLPSS